MDYEPALQYTRRSPHAQRRRRRAQQQSTCCGCLLALVIVVAGIMAVHGPLTRWREHKQELRDAANRSRLYFPLELTTDSQWYYRYSLVTINLRLQDYQGRPINTRQPPQLFVSHRGKVVETIGGVDRLTPRYDPTTHGYVAHWPVPWNAPLGVYTIETRYHLDKPENWAWETVEEQMKRQREARSKAKGKSEPPKPEGETFAVARASFELKGKPAAEIAPGMCAATWEETLPTDGLQLRRPDGKMGDWRAMYEWCQFMGADTLWVRGAITSSATTTLTLDEPFVKSNLAAIPRLAAEAHRRQLRFGAWATAYATLPENPGSNPRKPKYLWAQDISRSTGKTSDTSFVSFLDQRRVQHLADFMATMQADPNVDQVGLDYMRTEPGYELSERFAESMPVELPRDWDKMSSQDRWVYVAKRAEPPGCYEHPEFYDAWNWYRSHLGAEILARIVQRSNLQKPLWVFMLSWRHGTQHGQDPLMMTDAGVTMLAPMLYQTDVRQFDQFILREWPSYLRAGETNLMPGDQVDNYWHQQLGPEELYRRMLRAHYEFVRGGRTQGGFWHDISRAALAGNLGPYSGTEWALAGGAAFSKIRESWSTYPLRVSMSAPRQINFGVPMAINVKIENHSSKAVPSIKISGIAPAGVEWEDARERQVPELGPGETLTVPFTARITQVSQQRKNRFMVAFRLTWPDGDYGSEFRKDLPRVIIVMQYVQAG